MPGIVSLDRIRAARAALAGRVHRTPILTSETAARLSGVPAGGMLADGRLYLKAEHLQKTGSFKPRAALTRIAALTHVERSRGVVTLSAGNAGQAYAWAGRASGVPVTVVMPEGAVASKVDACRGYGAQVVLHGAHVGEAWDKVQHLVEDRQLTYVHPFDDPDVIAGNGSIGLEILEDLPEVDVVVVGIGGGGLISGIASAIKPLRPRTRILGVEPEGSDAMSRAIEHGSPVTIVPRSVADGLGAPFAGEWTLAAVGRYVDDVVLVDDATILAGVRFALERLKQVVEPAGAAGLAAILAGAVPIEPGARVCAVLSGGNVSADRLGELTAAAGSIPGLP